MPGLVKYKKNDKLISYNHGIHRKMEQINKYNLI